jgi:superfamily I DNA/RNA helicase/RecB family exonuclease
VNPPTTETTYRLVRPDSRIVEGPELDSSQQAVVDHPGGPLLVLAGPGTGKTTTLVEAIVDRIENRGASPESVLALTFSRKAAEQLRDRVTARLGRTTSTTMCSTFHSFAYGLIRQFSPGDSQQGPLGLLTAPEQDVMLRELLSNDEAAVRWPDGFRAAVETRGFAAEVASVIARAQERGVGYEELRRLGAESGREEFVAAGYVMEQYDEVLAQKNRTDYASLIADAGTLAQRPDINAELQKRYRHVFVDEYQDTDPAQVRLLRGLAGGGRDLVVVGDPHQSIYGFRGADHAGIYRFPERFPDANGAPAPTVHLPVTRRFGPTLLRATRNIIAGSIAAEEPDAEARAATSLRAFLGPGESRAEHPGEVLVQTHDTDRGETEHIADLLRRAHLEDGYEWDEMAVLVRSGKITIPSLRRSLIAAGVPVEVAADETPLVREPAIAPLLDALRVVVDGSVEGRADDLLMSPLAGLDAVELRLVARALRAREKTEAAAAGRPPRSSPELLEESLLRPEILSDDDPAVGKVRAFVELLRRAREVHDSGGSAESVLWVLWSGTSWPGRLRRAVETGAGTARLAHRDLDAVCALFETAARSEEQGERTTVETFLDTLLAQQIPADTLADRGVRGAAVRLLTAHRSKGLEWRLVVVAHVQQDGWPDVRRRASLLQADRIAKVEWQGTAVLGEPTSTRELLAEERRLFYVACTRARERLVVTAVASPEDDGDQASPFLSSLGEKLEHFVGRPPRPMSLNGLVAELRRAVADPETTPALRAVAADRLAALARERSGSRVLVPHADPGTWWGTLAPTHSDTPLRDPDLPIRLSASDLDGIDECSMKWFLEREAGGARESNSSQGFGLIVHALADRIAKGELEADPDDLSELVAYVDKVWDQITFRTPWAKVREHEQLSLALARFVRWHQEQRGRRLLATEARFVTPVELPDGQVVELRGFADRIEIDEEGKIVVIDLKTGKYHLTKAQTSGHVQLGLYQFAAQHGAFTEVAGDAECGGAEIVQLRASDTDEVRLQPQAAGDEGHVRMPERLMEVTSMLRSEQFTATAGDHCRYCDFLALCPVKGPGTVFDR